MSTQGLPASTIQAATIIHFVFVPIAAGLLAFLTYLYLAHPRRVGGRSVAAPQWHDPRPRSLLPLLIAAAFTGTLSHVLNALYISQSLPLSSDLDLHISSLTFTSWLVLMTSATIMQHLPVALLVVAVLMVLRGRYHALLHRVNEKGDWVPGPFLGWVGKEGASMTITYMLFLFPIGSRVVLSVGLTLSDSPFFLPAGATIETGDFSSWDRMLKLALVLENCRIGFLGIAVFDIAVSSYYLYKEGSFWGVSDSVTAASLHLITPLLAVQAVQTIISSCLVSATAPSLSTVSTLDLASTTIVSVTTYLAIALLTFLVCTPHRWDLQISPDSAVIRLGPIRLSEGDSNTLVSGDYPETPKSAVMRHTV